MKALGFAATYNVYTKENKNEYKLTSRRNNFCNLLKLRNVICKKKSDSLDVKDIWLKELGLVLGTFAWYCKGRTHKKKIINGTLDEVESIRLCSNIQLVNNTRKYECLKADQQEE